MPKFTQNHKINNSTTIPTTIKLDLRGLACFLSASNTKNDKLYHPKFLMPLNRLKIVFFFFSKMNCLYHLVPHPIPPPTPLLHFLTIYGGVVLLITSHNNSN